ncbi:MAG: hypothetical protein QXJ62_01495 [Nitrososphaeria archaeon]
MVFRRLETKKEVRIKQVSHNVKINDLELRDVNFGKFKKILIFNYKYTVDYLLEKESEKIGEIIIDGEILYLDEEKKLQEMEKEWKKDKKIDPEIMRQVLQAAIDNAQVEAIYNAKKVLLPSPIPLGVVKKGEEQGYIG